MYLGWVWVRRNESNIGTCCVGECGRAGEVLVGVGAGDWDLYILLHLVRPGACYRF